MKLEDVIATHKLAHRPLLYGEIREHASTVLRDGAIATRSELLTAATALLLQSCAAGSAGISILSTEAEDEIRWEVVCGEMQPFQGSRFPLRHSMCGIAALHHETQLFVNPQVYFRWMGQVGTVIRQAVVTPLFDVHPQSGGTIVRGTMWIMSHTETDWGGAQADVLEAIARELESQMKALNHRWR